MVLVVIDYATRKVEIAGIIEQAHGNWMKQMAKKHITSATLVFNLECNLCESCLKQYGRGEPRKYSQGCILKPPKTAGYKLQE